MTLTLSQARVVVEDNLDDAANARWTHTQVDTALQAALSQCLDEYIAAGGERFDMIASITSTTGGIVSLTSQDPLAIQGVSVLWGNRYCPVKSIRPEERGIADGTSRTVQVRYVPRMAIPTTTSHPLVGSGATAYNSWYAFEHWVCAVATLLCTVKDAEVRQEVMFIEQSFRKAVLDHSRIPKQRGFPMAAGAWSDHLRYVKDTWIDGTKQLALVIV